MLLPAGLFRQSELFLLFKDDTFYPTVGLSANFCDIICHGAGFAKTAGAQAGLLDALYFEVSLYRCGPSFREVKVVFIAAHVVGMPTDAYYDGRVFLEERDQRIEFGAGFRAEFGAT